MKSFSADHVKLWGHILLNMPVTGDRSFAAFEKFCEACRSLQGLAIAECNGELTPRQQVRQKTLTAKVEAYAKSVGMVATVGGDPRGYVVKVKWPDLGRNTPSNTWGGPEDGWGVGLQGRNPARGPLVRRALTRPPQGGKGEKMYKIVRRYFKGGSRVIKRHLTEQEAQAHCKNPETSSSTAKGAAARKITARMGEWFDGYEWDGGKPLPK